MPRLSEISYSREATVAAFTDYFEFIAKMYIKESAILRPPEGGWPEMTAERLRERGLNKSDEVVQLLRHLPYLAELWDGSAFDAGPEGTGFYSWLAATRWEKGIETALQITEGSLDLDEGLIPPHVIGLAESREDHFLLDTKLGVIYWPNAPDGIRHTKLSHKRIWDDPYHSEYTPAEEADWRAAGPVWAIADFFELLKDSFRRLFFVPFSSQTVWLDEHRSPETEPVMRAVQAVYREHGWPDLERYRKNDCLRAVEAMLNERFPEMVEDHEEYDYE